MGTIYPLNEDRIQGGVEAVANYLTRGLQRRTDIDLHIVSCSRFVGQSGIERRGSTVIHWLKSGSRLNLLRGVTVDALRTWATFRAIKPDVIHVQGFSEYAIGSRGLSPMLLTVHGLEHISPSVKGSEKYRGAAGIYRKVLSRWLMDKSVANCTAVVSIAGDYTVRAMGSSLPRTKPLFYIPNPVADEFFSLPPGNPRRWDQALSVSVIDERKNILGLVRAFAHVVKQMPQATLVHAGVVGEPAYFNRILAEVKNLGLATNVRFAGRVTQQELLGLYHDSSVVVLASAEESAPMCLAQAMAVGRPVIATNVGGVPWLVPNGIAGRIVEWNDPEAMGAAVVALMSDRDEQRRMGRSGHEAARQRFSSDAVCKQTHQAYLKLLDGKSS
jgi:glycosyltransferase involved in cell wall biosynthesis